MKIIRRMRVLSLLVPSLVVVLLLVLLPLRAGAQVVEVSGRGDGRVKIQVLIFDGFEVTDALAPFDVLKIASRVGAPFDVSLVTMEGAAEEVTALDGVKVKRTATFDPTADLLIVPGAPALWRNNVMPAGLAATLQAWTASRGKTLVTVCTGAVFAARAGVITGRNANTHKAAVEVVRQLGVNVIGARVVDDGNLISSAGVTSGIDLALYLVERHAGSQVAFATEQIVEYERRGTVWKAPRR
jgi:transcriptional regulator GlxA family with amidase domain